MYKMKRYKYLSAICLVAAALFSACTQDELAEQGTAQPEGKYPLRISSIIVKAECDAQPQGANTPQTRVAENADGSGSVWSNGDRIRVCIGDIYEKEGEYELSVGADGNVTSINADTPAYWQNRNSAVIHAWYATESTPNTVRLDQQDMNGLAYVLKGESEGEVQFDREASLTFTHQLAKVRVVLGGATENVSSVLVYNYTQCTHTRGTVSINDANLDWVPMRETKYNGQTCWEANIVPGTVDGNNFIRFNGNIIATVTGITELAAGNMYTVGITIIPSDATENPTGNISGNGSYKITGSRTEAINITGGSPNIYLDGASVSVSNGPAISITSNASPTIHVVGDNNTVQCTGSTRGQEGAGIYVAQGSTVTITGSSTEDKLTAIGGGGGAGIGGYYLNGSSNFSCGDIYISNVTVTARGSGSVQNDYASGIGAAGSATVGSINISNAVVYAYGTGSSNYGAAAIGGGISSTSVTNKQTEFSIIISDSEVYATRGSSSASYIGMAGDRLASPANYNIISTAHTTNSTIYNESGIEITQ